MRRFIVPGIPSFLPKDRELLVKAPTIRVSGHYTVDLIDAKTGLIKRHLEFSNIITDTAIDEFIGNNTIMSDIGLWMSVGTDSTTPTAADSGLGTEVSTRSVDNGGFGDVKGYQAGPPDYHYHRVTRKFAEANGNGNLTEVGMFASGTIGGVMWSRQLFKDMGGTPTTITKTSSDQLIVTYEMRCYPPDSDFTDTVTISGTDYDYTIRPQYINQSGAGWANFFSTVKFGTSSTSFAADAFASDVLIARTAARTGTNATADSVTLASYVSGDKYRDRTYKWEPTNTTANGFGGIGTICDIQGAGHLFQVTFSPKFAKDASNRLTLVMRHAFAQFTP